MATQAVRPCKSDDESLLLVEGRNDCNAVFQLVRLRHGADPAFGIFDCENDDGVLDQLSSRLAQPIPRQKILGLILDADIEGSTEADAVLRRCAQLKERFGADYKLSLIHIFEAGMSLYGHEISDEINVFEAGLERWLKLDKGEFIGREALLAVQAAGGPKRKIVALEMVERGIGRDGYPVLDLEGREIGVITSGSPAPFLKTNIALALVPAEAAAGGEDLSLIHI